jgi:hypothetical protein
MSHHTRIFRLSWVLLLSSGLVFLLGTVSRGQTASVEAATRSALPHPPTPAALRLAASPIVVDHNSVALFESIPENYLQAAEDLSMLFVDRSVGGNISDGLTCLSYPTDEQAPSSCRRLDHVDPSFTVDPSELDWNRPGGYTRSNWIYNYWPGTGCGGWYEAVGCFATILSTSAALTQVVSFQFSYLEVISGSSIDNQPGGFFWNNPTLGDVYDLEALEAQHPAKVFIYWTTSLARSIGTPDSETFNNQMRQYADDHGKILFDVADILSHDPDGNPCYDNRDGVPYVGSNGSENYPDDGLNIPAICQHYTTEIDGGHLGSVSVGAIRTAKAFWVLMAQIAGWNPNVNQDLTVDAGLDQIIQWPLPAQLSGTVSNLGGFSGTLTATWTLSSGPGPITFSHPVQVSFSSTLSITSLVTFATTGTYDIRLTGDSRDAVAHDEMTIQVVDQIYRLYLPLIRK